jgi:uncharacterized RDD family membrane protein YckC
MSQYPQQYGYAPYYYQPVFWQTALAVIVDMIIIVALAAWAFSLVKKSFKGEEVELP